MWNKDIILVECKRIADEDGKHALIDAQGAFIAGAAFQYGLMKEEIDRLNRVISTYQIELQWHTDEANAIWNKT